MKLLTKANLKSLPALYSQDGKPKNEVKVPVKLFSPYSNWTWYATEFDPEEGLFFGLVKGFEEELGYFSLQELEECKKGVLPLIERDIYWDPNTTLEQVMNGDKR